MAITADSGAIPIKSGTQDIILAVNNTLRVDEFLHTIIEVRRAIRKTPESKFIFTFWFNTGKTLPKWKKIIHDAGFEIVNLEKKMAGKRLRVYFTAKLHRSLIRNS